MYTYILYKKKRHIAKEIKSNENERGKKVKERRVNVWILTACQPGKERTELRKREERKRGRKKKEREKENRKLKEMKQERP